MVVRVSLSKYHQERLCLLVGGAYVISSVALRFFQVYGPHQALSNPYSGVLAIFAARLLNNRAPLIFEDGEQRRDFVYVGHVAEAYRLTLGCEAAVGRAFNIGSGRAVTINQVARLLADALGSAIEPEVPANAGWATSDIASPTSRRPVRCSAIGRKPRSKTASPGWSPGSTGGSRSIA
jgi:dTDP-L-rhamnose 4-epimerase